MDSYSLFDLGYDNLLNKPDLLSYTPELMNVIDSGTAPKNLISGEMVSDFYQKAGTLYNGKTDFTNVDNGWILGIDPDDGLAKFYLGDATSYLNFDTVTGLTIAGAITATAGTIGGFSITATTLSATNLLLDSANQLISLGTGNDIIVLDADDATYRIWVGDAAGSTAPFSVSKAGALVATSASVTGAITTGVGSTINGTYVDSLAVSKLTAGTITSETILLAVNDGDGDTYIASGKTDFTVTDAGFILGVDDSDSDLAKFYIGDATNYLYWNGTDLNLNGSSVQAVVDGATTDYTYGLFRGSYVDGLSTATANSTITRKLLNTYFTNSTAGGWHLYSDKLGTQIYSSSGSIHWNNNIEFFARMQLDTMTADSAPFSGSSIFFGLIDDAEIMPSGNPTISSSLGTGMVFTTANCNHCGFFLARDNKLYASVANGTTTETSEITGITHTDSNNYKFIITANDKVDFYVNDVLKVTLTTYNPVATNNYPSLIFTGQMGQNTGNTIDAILYNNYKIKIT